MDVILIFNETHYLDTVIYMLCGWSDRFRAVEARNVRSVLQEEEILRFDRTVLDVGTLTEDDAPQTYRFICTNVSGKTVKLTRVRTTCGCYGG